MSLLEVRATSSAATAPVRVLHGLDFTVDEGEVVVILGANGAGKTTTLRAISGMIDANGHVRFDGHDILGRSAPSKIAAAGIAHVPAGPRHVRRPHRRRQPALGAYTAARRVRSTPTSSAGTTCSRGSASAGDQQAGSMSGGEQQMLAIARALMARPKLVLLDEPSLGLAPIVTQELFRHARRAEPRARALDAHRRAERQPRARRSRSAGYVLETGTIVASGSADELASNDDVRRAYLGI